MRRPAIGRSVRALAGVVVVAALTVVVSLANRMPHHSFVPLCCRYTPARLAGGAWWTVLGSALLVSRLKLLGINTALVLGVVVPYAWREGNRRALTVYFAGHVVATLAVAAVVLPLAAGGWGPAEVVRTKLDAGASAGIASVTGAMAVSLAWRRAGVALFAGVAAFFAVHLVAAATLADLEHLLALTTGAAVGASSPIHGLRRRLGLTSQDRSDLR
jgi:hypothetical protein